MAQSDTSLVIRDRSFFNATPWHRATLLSQSPAWQAFPCGLGANNEERGSKTARKMAQVTERGRGLPMAQSDTTLSVRERSFFKRHPVAQRDTALSERDRCYFFSLCHRLVQRRQNDQNVISSFLSCNHHLIGAEIDILVLGRNIAAQRATLGKAPKFVAQAGFIFSKGKSRNMATQSLRFYLANARPK